MAIRRSGRLALLLVGAMVVAGLVVIFTLEGSWLASMSRVTPVTSCNASVESLEDEQELQRVKWSVLRREMSLSQSWHPAVDVSRDPAVEGSQSELQLGEWDEAYMRPSVFVLGCMKCGTTSLHGWLKRSNIIDDLVKESHYWTGVARKNNFIAYMRSFPLLNSSKAIFAADCTPGYLFFSESVSQLSRFLQPGDKLIIILRDPYDRTLSHYRFQARLKDLDIKTRPRKKFQDTMFELIEGWIHRSKFIEDTAAFFHEQTTEIKNILDRSIYVHQLARWQAVLRPDQPVMVIPFKLLTRSFEEHVREPLLRFLGVSPDSIEHVPFPSSNVGSEKTFHPKAVALVQQSFNVSADVERTVRQFFEPFNQQLEQFLRQQTQWTVLDAAHMLDR